MVVVVVVVGAGRRMTAAEFPILVSTPTNARVGARLGRRRKPRSGKRLGKIRKIFPAHIDNNSELWIITGILAIRLLGPEWQAKTASESRAATVQHAYAADHEYTVPAH
jgi:hypothetical protein